MSSTVAQKHPPRYTVLTSESAIERSARSTRRGVYGLLPSEIAWKERQPFLEKRGYILRKRYSPNWEPSWIGTNLTPMFCEDSVMLMNHQIMDAKQREGGELVAIKTVRNDSDELEITQFLSEIRDKENHCVPVLHTFPDPLDSQITLMVMPYLRPCNDPEFCAIGEIVDFIDQALEGLVFLHANRVAHRDIAVVNIMMDGRALYPEGHHPVRLDFAPDAVHKATPSTRTQHPVRYFYIDFGLSVQLSPGESPLVVGDVGRDEEVPELSSDVPYDAFKVDIFALGNIFSKEFEEKFNDMQFLLPLIEHMKHVRPEMRPPIDHCLEQWKGIRSLLNVSQYRRRLSPKTEQAYERAINDTVSAAWGILYELKKLVKS